MSESILEEAQRLIHGDRNKNYGHPRENFSDIAALFSGYLGVEVSDIDVANLMILVKVARVKGTGYHRDSFVDIAGYAGCVERIYEEPVELPYIGGNGPGDVNDPEVVPRKWDSLAGVPTDVKVFDREGDYWTFYGDSWGFGDPGEIERNPVNSKKYGLGAWDHFGPFTEVVGG